MKYISDEGTVWKLTDHQYDVLLAQVRRGDNINLNHHGEIVARDTKDLSDLIVQSAAQESMRREGEP